MGRDEVEIREVVRRWMVATIDGDAGGVLDLMTDNVVFSVVGREPFGKETFAALSQRNETNMSIKGTNEIVEIKVLGEWAFTRNRIGIAMTQDGAEPMRRAGYTLTLFRKERDGHWRIARDANMLSAA